MNEVWDNEDYHDWAARWTSMCGMPPDRLEECRQAYEAEISVSVSSPPLSVVSPPKVG